MNNFWNTILFVPEFLFVFFLPGFFMTKIFIGEMPLFIRIFVSIVLSILVVPTVCFLAAIVLKSYISKSLVFSVAALIAAGCFMSAKLLSGKR